MIPISCKNIVILSTIVLCALVVTLMVALPERVPKIRVTESSTYHYGEVDQGTIIRHSFQFVNAGWRPLVIKKVTTGCGCTSAKVAKLEYLPNEAGKLEVVLDTGASASETIQIILETNDPVRKYEQFILHGSVRAILFCSPESLVLALGIGEGVRANTSKTVVLKTDKQNVDLIIEEVRTSSGKIEASIESNEVLASKRMKSIRVETTRLCPLGQWREAVYVKCRVGGLEKVLTIPVYVELYEQ